VQAWSQPGALQAALNWYRALNLEAALAPEGVRSVPELGQASGVVDVPTLVVWGERDGSFPAACLQGLERWVPDLRVHREPAGGHWLLEERPALAASLLRDFLAFPGPKD
jgi:pimeloyl-ACP methyl ester carboxylesterase